MRMIHELFPNTVHRDKITMVLIMTKFGKQKKIDKINEKKAYNSLRKLQSAIIEFYQQENMSNKAKSGFIERKTDGLDGSTASSRGLLKGSMGSPRLSALFSGFRNQVSHWTIFISVW